MLTNQLLDHKDLHIVTFPVVILQQTGSSSPQYVIFGWIRNLYEIWGAFKSWKLRRNRNLVSFINLISNILSRPSIVNPWGWATLCAGCRGWCHYSDLVRPGVQWPAPWRLQQPRPGPGWPSLQSLHTPPTIQSLPARHSVHCMLQCCRHLYRVFV